MITLLSALLLVACNDKDKADTNAGEGGVDQSPAVEIKAEEIVDSQEVILKVNDTEIYGNKYNNVYKQVKTMLHMQGQDVSDLDLLKEETINILTDQELIRQDALASGIEVTEEEVQDEIDTIIETSGEEAIKMMLEEYEMTDEEFRAQLMEDMITIKYMESELQVEVTDEEVEEYYELLKEEYEDIGELEENESLIREALSLEKQGQLLNERISELKENAEIEVLI